MVIAISPSILNQWSSHVDVVSRDSRNMLSLSPTDSLSILPIGRINPLNEINNELYYLNRELEKGYPAPLSKSLHEVLSSVDLTKNPESLEQMTANTDYPGLGKNLVDLLTLLERLIAWRGNYITKKSKKNAAKKMFHERDRNFQILDRQREMSEEAITKIGNIFKKIFDDLDDEIKVFVDIQVSSRFPSLGTSMGTRLWKGGENIRSLLGIKLSPAAKKLRERMKGARVNGTENRSNKVAQFDAIPDASSDTSKKFYIIYPAGKRQAGNCFTAKIITKPKNGVAIFSITNAGLHKSAVGRRFSAKICKE